MPSLRPLSLRREGDLEALNYNPGTKKASFAMHVERGCFEAIRGHVIVCLFQEWSSKKASNGARL